MENVFPFLNQVSFLWLFLGFILAPLFSIFTCFSWNREHCIFLLYYNKNSFCFIKNFLFELYYSAVVTVRVHCYFNPNIISIRLLLTQIVSLIVLISLQFKKLFHLICYVMGSNGKRKNTIKEST